MGAISQVSKAGPQEPRTLGKISLVLKFQLLSRGGWIHSHAPQIQETAKDHDIQEMTSVHQSTTIVLTYALIISSLVEYGRLLTVLISHSDTSFPSSKLRNF